MSGGYFGGGNFPIIPSTATAGIIYSATNEKASSKEIEEQENNVEEPSISNKQGQIFGSVSKTEGEDIRQESSFENIEEQLQKINDEKEIYPRSKTNFVSNNPKQQMTGPELRKKLIDMGWTISDGKSYPGYSPTSNKLGFFIIKNGKARIATEERNCVARSEGLA